MLSLPIWRRARLGIVADAEIQHAIAGRHKGREPEVDAVASVLINGVPGIAHAWAAMLKAHGRRVTLSSVFCHKTPEVRFARAHQPQATCELADLLIVMDDFVGKAVPDRRAVLIQAKVAKRSFLRPRGDELKQLELLLNWPRFVFKHRGFNGHQRNFRASSAPGSWRDSGRYGAIVFKSGSERWVQLRPGRTMHLHSGLSLGEEMANMLCGRSGRRAIPGGNDPWSETIDDLLRVTGIQRLTSTYGGGSRRVDAKLVQTLMSFATADWMALRVTPHSITLQHGSGPVEPDKPGREGDPRPASMHVIYGAIQVGNDEEVER